MANFGIPVGSMASGTFNDTEVSIPNGNYDYVVLQVNVGTGTWTDTGEICRYRVDGTTPTTGVGFILGDKDYVIFQKGELDAGVEIITAEAGVAGKYHYQAYRNLPR